MHRRPRCSDIAPANGASKIRLLIADAQEISRIGTVVVLKQAPQIKVVSEAATISAALRTVKQQVIDVALLDLRFPDGNAIDACRQIRMLSPITQVVLLTDAASDEVVVPSLRAGVAGVLVKTILGPALVRAIETVATGYAVLDRSVLQHSITHLCSLSVATCGRALVELSAQEHRVMELVAQGQTNKEIAVTLGLSDKTVKNYLSHVFEKLQVTRRAQATSSFLERMRARTVSTSLISDAPS